MNVLLGLLLLLSLQALILKIFQILRVSSSVHIEVHIKNRFGRPFFPWAPCLQWDCTPPIDDEGSGNRLHLTRVLSWNILIHRWMSVMLHLLVLNWWTLSRSMLSDTTAISHTSQNHHIQYSVHHSMRISHGFLSLWRWGFEAPSSLNIPFASELSQASSLWSRSLYGGGPQWSDTSGWCGRGTPSHRNWQRRLCLTLVSFSRPVVYWRAFADRTFTQFMYWVAGILLMPSTNHSFGTTASGNLINP